MRREKWIVYGVYGDSFTNLKDAKRCAKEASTTPEHDYEADIWNLDDGLCYIEYQNGKCVRDGWTVKKKEEIVMEKETLKFSITIFF